jgi:hypothetical protein
MHQIKQNPNSLTRPIHYHIAIYLMQITKNRKKSAQPGTINKLQRLNIENKPRPIHDIPLHHGFELLIIPRINMIHLKGNRQYIPLKTYINHFPLLLSGSPLNYKTNTPFLREKKESAQGKNYPHIFGASPARRAGAGLSAASPRICQCKSCGLSAAIPGAIGRSEPGQRIISEKSKKSKVST